VPSSPGAASTAAATGWSWRASAPGAGRRRGRWGRRGRPSPPFLNAPASLLFATAVPHGWSVLELDGDGRPGRTASVTTAPSARNERPVVAPGAGGVTFRFPAAAVEKTAPWAAADERQPRPARDPPHGPPRR